ncbi:type 1 glutamine amidotransferase [Fructobacillus papyrifericola]|uniref:Type 1 glutamine amidotransferase n=1 Tax=Fructobacillus papyrifericola TaxID=2713172 RepID=A0ABS5QTL7_9LACO|nr:type 1 glutamine amidotransferase [Fructobacillus papyrifericola]MBS9335746.1 type 1 glutamine amidotransferase [Fructobacillus papyrifericola]
MRINILQHTSNEGPGAIIDWANERGHEVYTYHPDQFGTLPKVAETDLLVILGGPMSPNDDFPWIFEERQLILALMDLDKPIFGACFGAQQITKALGYPVSKSPEKEVGWAPVTLQSHIIPNVPDELFALHWHEEMFEIPAGADLLFSTEGLKNQGFVMNHRVIGLQFHFEPLANNVREMVVNDFSYIEGSVLGQTAEDILEQPVPRENRRVMFALLDYICQ